MNNFLTEKADRLSVFRQPYRYCVEQLPSVAVYAMLNVSHCVCDLARMPVTVPLAMIDMHRRVYA